MQAYGWIDGIAGALIGSIITVLCALAAKSVGYLQIDFMRKAHELNVVKTTPRIGCDVSAESRQILNDAFRPHIFVTLKIYNEGELAVEKVTGQWKLLPHDVAAKRVFEIARDFLGHCDQYAQTHQINESVNWPDHALTFDVEVDFFYTIPGEKAPGHYSAKYYYHAETGRMIKRDYV